MTLTVITLTIGVYAVSFLMLAVDKAVIPPDYRNR